MHLKVLSAGAVKYVVTGLAPQFTRDSGHAVDFTFGTNRSAGEHGTIFES